MSVLFPESFCPTGTLTVETDVVFAHSEPDRETALVGLPANHHDAFLAMLRSNGYRARKIGTAGGVSEWTLKRTSPHATPGRIVSQQGIRLDKNVRGTCHLEATEGVEVGEGAKWTGNIQGGQDIVVGKGSTINGNVATPATLKLLHGARIVGDIIAGRIEVAEAAAVVGRIHTNRAEATREH